MKIGYARVSRLDQSLDLQLDAMRSAGAERIYTDQISGAVKKRSGLDDLMENARAGDVVIVWRLDRLARSLQHLIEISAAFESRKIQLVSLTEQIDTTTPGGRLYFQLFGAIAEFERNLIRERTAAGLAAARARGRKGGRKPALTPEKKTAVDLQIRSLPAGVDPDPKAIGRAVGVSDRTIRRYLSGQYAGFVQNA